MAASLIELRIALDGNSPPRAELSAYRPYPPWLEFAEGGLAAQGEHIVLESSDGVSGRPIFQIVPSFVQATLDANGGRFPPGAGRIVLEMPARSAVDKWELEFGPAIGSNPVSFLRRIAPNPTERAPLEFPYGISLISDRLPATGNWVDVVFDEFVQRQLPPGIVADMPPESACIWHFIGESPDMLEHFLGQARPPRLIILQRLAQEIDPAILDLVASHGVGALLVTSGSDPMSLAFVRTFYRKVFHNEPLDRCMAIAIAEAQIPRQQVMLAAEPGGELSLLLTRVPLEIALAGPGIAAAARARTRDGSRTYLEAPARELAVPARQLRSAREMLVATQTAMRHRSFEQIGGTMSMLHHLQFAGEQHDVFVVKTVSDQVAASLARDLSSLEDVYNSAGAVRYTSLTLRDATGREVWPKERALVPNGDHMLDVAITPAPGEAQVRIEFDESKLRPLFEREEQVALDVVVFAPDDEFSVKERRQTIRLPRVGRSTNARFGIVPRRSGWCRLRVAIFHRNALLQSVAFQAYASHEAPPADCVSTIVRQLDWASSTDLLLLGEQSAPVVSVFTNDAPDGSHWIGVFAGDEEAPDALRVGQMRKLDSHDMTERAKNLRDALQTAHGLPDYRYPAAAAPDDPAVVQFGIDTLTELAVRGREVFSYLFQGMTDISPQRLKSLRGAIGQAEHGTISIARCDARWTIPWAALYDYGLDVNRPQDLNVCSVFLSQLAANEWDPSGERVVTVHDLLPSPSACRAQSDCPLNGRHADVTICPFGFWGFRNLIEEPLAQVTATGDDEVPEEMKRGTFSQSVIIPYEQAEGLRVGAGAFPFPRAGDHQQEMAKLLGDGLRWETDREKVVKLLYDEQGHHVFYFYCHGVAGSEFAIQVGPEGALHNLISQASLDLDKFHWAERGNPQPLVVLIACESSAARPETMHGLIGFLRNAMASGVLGSEITIDTGLGRAWGYRFMSSLVTGQSVGECFLQLRHELLRRYNPLGLAFSMYAPASLHICGDPTGNGACARYHAVPSAI